MAKKLGIKTKLTKLSSPEAATEKLNLIEGVKTYPRSYRWREYDLELIESLVDKVNSISSRRIDVTKILRGAICLADKKSPEKLLEAIMEAEKKSLISRLK